MFIKLYQCINNTDSVNGSYNSDSISNVKLIISGLRIIGDFGGMEVTVETNHLTLSKRFDGIRKPQSNVFG